MGSLGAQRPHVVCIPYPAQGHINPIQQLAKLLHFRGFYITFVNTEFNHQRLVRSRGPDSVKGFDDFRFVAIPDGLPMLDQDHTQDIPALCASIRKNCHPPFLNLLKKINTTLSMPPVTCIISDGVMSFTLQAAEELGIPEYVFFTPSACGLMGYLHCNELIERGYIPLKDESYLNNGYLDTRINWIPGMRDITLRELPSFIRTTNRDDIMLNYDLENVTNATRAKGVILNTFEDLEGGVLDAIRSKFSFQTYTIGPLVLLSHQISESPSKSIGLNLWKVDTSCIEWLDTKEPRSVLYVNFGSIVVMTAYQMREFAWGLANSKHPFLWVIRPDLVMGELAILPEDFIEETKGRCLLAGWCAQEQVLAHPSVGGFLTHCGWNSTIESICSGVPMICWPFLAEQQTNCRFTCTEWRIGMEIDNNNVKGDKVEALVRELMEGEKGKEMKKKAMEWKERAENATKPGGSSYENLDKLFNEILLDNY
ncbi:7-deoxyloganetin glucosyltransferase-like [Magnolia sinica]|uniref:7-deoxyloganetin glucosyltransferase-like n=1 Tax=Magnolia sinica TaxID=86752 RepID=UPI002658150B|nr:7-deoxyloganetin glucosyltransferase-like [Magnolia sinica]